MIDTKRNLDNSKFEQTTGDTLNLSGTTRISGDLIIEQEGTIDSFADYKLSGETLNLEQFTGSTSANLVETVTNHTGDTDIHYAQSAITITQSQVTGLESALASKADLLDLTGLTETVETHTGDTDIHYAQSAITLTQSQVTDLTNDLAGKTDTGTTAQLQSDLNIVSGVTIDNTSEINKIKLFGANGVISGFTLSMNGASGTTFNLSEGKGLLVDNHTDPNNPTQNIINYSGETGITLTYIASSIITYIGLTTGGTIAQQTTQFTPIQRRTHIIIGAVIHSDLTYVNAVNNLPDVITDGQSQFNDLLDGLKSFNVDGNIINSNGSNLQIDKNAGILFQRGVNFYLDDGFNPHQKMMSSLTAPSNLRYRLSDGTEYGDTNSIDTNYWENPLGSRIVTKTNSFYVQRAVLFSSNLIRIQYGQGEYGTMSDAIDGMYSENFQWENNMSSNGLFRAFIIVKGGITDLSNTLEAQFIEVDKFGSMPKGGGTTIHDWNELTNKPAWITGDTAQEFALGHTHTGTTGNTELIYTLSGQTTGNTESINSLNNDLSGLTETVSNHTGDTDIHYVQSAITITQSQVTGLESDLSNLNDGITGNTELINTITGATETANDEANLLTGFIDNQNIDVSYNSTNRTITLTHGTEIVYYWKGVRYSLGTSWTSSGHTANTLDWYLYSTDGLNFVWSNTVWNFTDLMVSIRPKNTTIGTREIHGTMDWNSHEESHRTTGTYKVSGFGFTDGTYEIQPSSPTNANNTFGLEAGIIADEDLKSNIDAWIQDSYTTLYFTGSGETNFQTTQSNYAIVTGTYPNYYTWDGSGFTETEMLNNRYANYYVIRVPVSSDVGSQNYRAIVVSPQFSYATATAALAEEPQSLYFGDITSLFAEMVIVERITIRTSASYGTTGKYRINAVKIISGTRFSQIIGAVGAATTAGNVSVVPTVPYTSTDLQAQSVEYANAITSNETNFNSHSGDTSIHFEMNQITGFTTTTQVTGLTLTSTSWSLVSGYWEYDLSNGNITSSSIVDVIPDNDSVTIIQTANVLPKTVSSSGSVKLYAMNEPTDDISVTINIFK